MTYQTLDKNLRKVILLRDFENRLKVRCVSCNKEVSTEDFNCGHYISRRYLPIRYDLRNVHVQCQFCNWADGTLGAGIEKAKIIKEKYRGRLIKKIGISEVEDLEKSKNNLTKFGIFEKEAINNFLKKITKDNVKELGFTSQHTMLQ